LYRSQNIIQTARLNLREIELHDAQFILELLNEAGFLRFIGDKGVRTLADAREYILKGPIDSYRSFGFGLYLASLRESAAPIGICGLVKREALPDVDLGFAFLSRYWSKGYAVEAAAAVLAHGQNTLELGRIVAITAPDNRGSIAVLEKIGLRLEGRIKLVENGVELELYGPPAP